MGTLGNKPAAGFQSIEKQSITGNGGTSYALDHAVTNVNDLEVFVNNVRQEPTTAYTLSGQNIVMSEAIANTDSFYVIYQSRSFTKAVPADTSVTNAMLQNDAVTSAKVQDDAITSAKLATNIAVTGTLNVSGGTTEPAASVAGGGSGYTQGAIALKSGTTSDPKNRGQGVFLFNEGNDTTWYIGTPYDTGSAGSRPVDFMHKTGTTSLDAITAHKNNTKIRIHPDGTISAPSGIELGGGYANVAALTLNDYETGSFQLTMTGESSGSPVGHGIYAKIGNMCIFNWYSGTRTISSAVAPVLGGLPFTHTSPYGSGGAYATVSFCHNTYINNSSTGYVNIGTTSIYPTTDNSSGGTVTATGSKYIMCSGSYYCD